MYSVARIRIPLSPKLNSRSATLAKDAFAANCYFETKGDRKEVFKRPGHALFPTTGDTVTPGLAQGMTVFDNKLVVIVADVVYMITQYGVCTRIGTISSSVSTSGAVDTSAVDTVTVNYGIATSNFSKVWFTQTANGAYLFFHNGINAYYISSGSTSVTPVTTNVSSYAGGVAYLDTYCFVLGTNGRVYNSNSEDPTTWGALNFITAQSDPDLGVCLVRQLNYIVAFGQWSTEFFYDAANPTASPLSVQQALKIEVGCADANSVTKIDQSVLWVGKSQLHGRAVYLLDNGTSPTKVSNAAIERYLNANTTNYMYSFAYTIEGHTFYVLTLREAGYSFVYDLNEQEWYVWTSYNGSAEVSYDLGFYVEFYGTYFCLDRTDGNVYQMSTTRTSDDVYPIYWRIVTDLIDDNTTNRKFYDRVELVGDKVAGSAVISNTNNDYVTWSTARSVNLNNSRSQLFNLGSGRRRAWQVLITDDIPIRMESLEVEYEVGRLEEGGA